MIDFQIKMHNSFCTLSDASKHYKTTCQGYEAKISDCSKLNDDGVECNNNGHAYVNCKTMPKFEWLFYFCL